MTDRTSQETEVTVLEVLDSLKILYETHHHPPVYTVEEAEEHWKSIKGTHCKNLFVRNKKGNRHYLVVLESRKRADLRELNMRLGEDRLSFASPERLKRYLGLKPGAVSPFGLINDTGKGVQVVMDKDLKEAKWVSFHPNVNTAMVTITFKDFEKYLEWCGNPFRTLSI